MHGSTFCRGHFGHSGTPCRRLGRVFTDLAGSGGDAARHPVLRTIGRVTAPAPVPGAAPRAPGPPAPLVVAVGLAAVEAGLLLGYGVAELFAVQGERLTMGLSTGLFFLMYGAGLGVCAWGGYRLHPWSRAPLVLAQLIQLGVAWSFRGGSGTPVAVAMAVVALVVLAGVFHPASQAALTDERAAADPG